MKPLLSLTAWNWRIFQKPYCLLLALTAAAELALVCIPASQRFNAAYDYAATFLASLAWAVFPVAYAAAICISLYPLAQAGGKSRAGYTLLTLPLPRATLLLGQMLATALALLVLIAWQVVLCMALYLPFTALQSLTGSGLVLGLPAARGLFYRSAARNLLLRMLVPASPLGAGALAAAVIAPAVLAPGALYQKGWRRAAALCLGLAGAGCCMALLAAAFYDLAAPGMYAGQAAAPAAGLAAAVAASGAWSLHSVRRARLL